MRSSKVKSIEISKGFYLYSAKCQQNLEQFIPDLLISDIAMPEMDGYMLMQQMRSLKPTSEVPAVALTAYAGEQDQRRSLAAGFQAHLAKPVDPKQLLQTIRDLMTSFPSS